MDSVPQFLRLKVVWQTARRRVLGFTLAAVLLAPEAFLRFLTSPPVQERFKKQGYEVQAR